jgi:hypothetical protein
MSFGQRVCVRLLLEVACSLTTTSAGIPASLEDALEDAITRALGRQLDRINTKIDEIKDKLAEIKGDLGTVARTSALVSLHSNFYFTHF